MLNCAMCQQSASFIYLFGRMKLLNSFFFFQLHELFFRIHTLIDIK